jgi:hypothetical protein
MTHDEFVILLNKWGIPHISNSHNNIPWYEHNRNSHGNWGPVNGIGNHHTGAADNQSGRDVLWHGYADLPGPLCHGGITADGKVLLNGWGRVNHFGLGDSAVLQHVVNEDYAGKLTPHKADVDGNSHFYGFEWMYDGLSDPETHHPKIYQTAVRLNAAINTFHNWTELSSIAHGEWQPGKWDPGYKKSYLFNVVRFRFHVHQAQQEGPKPALPSRPVPAKPKTKVITAVKGDTLYSIAKKYFDSPEAGILTLVNDNPGLLRAGDRLTVPNV